MVERNAGVAARQAHRISVGIHLGDVVEESDGDLMGDGVNIAARLEGIAKPGAICLSEDAYRQVKRRLDLRSPISARPNSRTSPSRSASIRCEVGQSRASEARGDAGGGQARARRLAQKSALSALAGARRRARWSRFSPQAPSLGMRGSRRVCSAPPSTTSSRPRRASPSSCCRSRT